MIAKEPILIKDIISSSQPVLVICQSFELVLDNILSILKLPAESVVSFDSSEGIEILRTKVADLYSKPLSSEVKLFYILESDNLSIEQANTLLKLIEEPPQYLKIILFAKNLSMVTPTIRSRAKKYVLPESNKVHESELIFSRLLSGSFFEFSSVVSKMDRPSFTKLLLQGIEESRENLLNKKDLEIYKLMVSALSKISSTNVNFKLLAEEIYLFNKT